MKNTVFLLALILSNTLSLGCSARAYVRHAQTAFALYGVNETAVPVIETVCSERATGAASDPSATTAEAAAAAQGVLERCGTMEQVQHRFAEGHRVWSLAMAQAADNYDRFDREASQRMLFRMYDIYMEIVTFVGEQFNRRLPTIPRIVLRFVE